MLDDRAEPLAGLRWPDRTRLLPGNEFDGLRPHWLSLCDRQVTIPMQRATDSSNLGVAAGIFVYEMMKREGGPQCECVRCGEAWPNVPSVGGGSVADFFVA